MMLILGTLFGIVGVLVAHIAMNFFSDYYLIFVFPILMAILLGLGLSQGAKLGGCSRFGLPVAILVLIFSVLCYGSLLFLNDYYASQAPPPATIPEELALLAEDGQNFVSRLPYAGDYVQPFPQTQRADQHLGIAVVNFIKKFPELAQHQPVIIGKIFNLSLFNSVRQYLMYQDITDWQGEEGKGGTLVFTETSPVQTWMLWSWEFLFTFAITLLITRGGTKKAYRSYLRRLEKTGFRGEKPNKSSAAKKQAPEKPDKKAKKEKTPKAKKAATEEIAMAPGIEEEATQAVQAQEKARQAKEKKKGVGAFFTWGKRAKKPAEEAPQETPAATPAEPKLAMEFPEDASARYALVLQQFDRARQSDLLLLIQQVAQLTEDKAVKLLKVPSLLKRDVSAEEARFAIEKFNQVQAQVKLITMAQLDEIQKRQQPAPPAPTSQPSASPTPKPQPAAPAKPAAAPAQRPVVTGSSDDRYALILKSFDPAQRKPVLELLASLSGRPVEQLQQSLKPPALILRDATKDEVMMIAQQFQNLSADVKSVTMAELQRMMSKGK